MKKITLLIFSLFLFVGILSSQTIDIIDSTGIVNNTISKVYNVASGTIYEYKVDLKNNTSNQVEVRMYAVNGGGTVNDWKVSFCSPMTLAGGGQCGLSGAPSAPIKLEANETTSTSGAVKFTQGSTSGEAVVKIEVKDVNGSFTDSFTIIFNTGSQSGISTEIVKEFSIYPNPASDNFKIKHNYGPNAVVEVYNMLGKLVTKVKSDFVNGVNIDASKWDNGYYFCRLYNDGKIQKTIKLVVAH
ncbi:MAG TPA: T9SS type A sorting domain-containing protein [Bacteroidales bacterium]|nr:T9SS type A sorting domain-containing protein [Bacteroidales bacterium]HQB20792.1 T9SS type A sorting domain-containing protein [Bacteroidales bacterium]